MQCTVFRRNPVQLLPTARIQYDVYSTAPLSSTSALEHSSLATNTIVSDDPEYLGNTCIDKTSQKSEKFPNRLCRMDTSSRLSALRYCNSVVSHDKHDRPRRSGILRTAFGGLRRMSTYSYPLRRITRHSGILRTACQTSQFFRFAQKMQKSEFHMGLCHMGTSSAAIRRNTRRIKPPLHRRNTRRSGILRTDVSIFRFATHAKIGTKMGF